MLKRLRNYFIAGVIVLLPLTASVYIFWMIFKWLDDLLGRPFRLIPWEVPGLGIISAIIIILLTGVLATNLVGKRLIILTHAAFTRIPVIRNIYLAIKQLVDSFTNEKKPSFKRVVLVEYPRREMYVLGFVTGEPGGEFLDRIGQDVLSIFVPTTPNPTSGMLIMAPKEDVTSLDMTIEEGLKFVISGGVVVPIHKHIKEGFINNEAQNNTRTSTSTHQSSETREE